MKNIYLLPILFCCWMVCMSSSCKKTPVDPNVDQLSLLPAATQTGANTMGALVNGKAFIPYDNSFYSNSYQCNYIYLNGGYYLTIAGTININHNITGIILSTTALSITEGADLKLENYNENGKAGALYYLINSQTTDYNTTTIVNGNLHITKFDQTKQIVSGTFSFKAVSKTAKDTVDITDGRFDMKYTQ